MTDIKEVWFLWFTNFYDKKSAGSSIANNEIKQNLQLAEELHKPVNWNLKKETVYSEFKDNIWSVDLTDVQLISKLNKGFRFSLCLIDIFNKYVRQKRCKYC